jgi:hypothetical protein
LRFIYADSLDVVDPDFDFATDRNAHGRVVHADDEYPHEFLRRAPYDGILVSRGIVGGSEMGGKYSDAQRMRFRRDGARAFLRYSEAKFPGSLVFGDCGAFQYRMRDQPPYTAADMADFYADGGFTHGCSVDHLIFDFDAEPARKATEVSPAVKDRYEITLSLAADFQREAKRIGRHFTPLGVIQGWSAASMAAAAAKLAKMGYTYLAVGGMVPLDEPQIHRALGAIRAAIPSKIRLHLLGFGKIERLSEYESYGVTSFDTTSPLLRAFKDAKRNYFASAKGGGLDYYTAIRVPQATRNTKLKNRAREGRLDQERIVRLETTALTALRSYDKRRAKIDRVLDAVIDYWDALNWNDQSSNAKRERALNAQREVYRRTLADRPWEACSCRTCREGGIESVIFRSSNRNKRRGIHNLHVFYKHLTKNRAAA